MENVLTAVDKAPSVQRVVLTSSVGAINGDSYERGEGWKPFRLACLTAQRLEVLRTYMTPRVQGGCPYPVTCYDVFVTVGVQLHTCWYACMLLKSC